MAAPSPLSLPAAPAGWDGYINLLRSAWKEGGTLVGAVRGFVPVLHAEAHECSDSHGAITCEGTGQRGEPQELAFAWMTALSTSLRSYSASQFRLALESAMANYNRHRNKIPPERLLHDLVTFIGRMHDAHDAHKVAVVEYGKKFPTTSSAPSIVELQMLAHTRSKRGESDRARADTARRQTGRKLRVEGGVAVARDDGTDAFGGVACEDETTKRQTHVLAFMRAQIEHDRLKSAIDYATVVQGSFGSSASDVASSASVDASAEASFINALTHISGGDALTRQARASKKKKLTPITGLASARERLEQLATILQKMKDRHLAGGSPLALEVDSMIVIYMLRLRALAGVTFSFCPASSFGLPRRQEACL